MNDQQNPVPRNTIQSPDSTPLTPRRVAEGAEERAFRETPRENAGARIELEIGELAIRGYSSRDRARIDAAFRRELERIITERLAAAPADDLVVSLDALDTITIPRGMRPEAVGEYVARVVGKAGGF